MTPTRRAGLLAAIVTTAVLCATGCKVQAAGASATSPASAASHARAAGLLQIHDPGKVTGTAPASCHTLSGPRPDPTCTPGAIDPAVTQQNIGSTICTSGYTTKVRPSTSQTNKMKSAMYRSYGIPAGTTSELDHLVSLELGGSNDAANLWPEVGKLPNPKDTVENALHKAVCSGKVTLAAAQQAIATNWETAESVLGIA